MIPFSLFPTKKVKVDTVNIVTSFFEEVDKDSINLFEVVTNEEESFFNPINQANAKRAFFNQDTIQLNYFFGSAPARSLKIEIVNNKFSTQIRQADGHWFRDKKIKNQFLKIEKPILVDKEKLRGYIFCEAINQNKNDYNKKVTIKGYFEMTLQEVSKL